MMLLFLAGSTELQDKEVYLQILHSFELQHHHPRHVLEAQSELEEESQKQIIFIAHLIYKAQNSSLSRHLASSVQKGGELSLTFNDLFHCTVNSHILSVHKQLLMETPGARKSNRSDNGNHPTSVQ